MKIALCTIVKNEEKIIRRMLDSVRGVVSGIYILDTGSTDNTVQEMVSWGNDNDFGVVISHSEFKGFAESRNEAMSIVSSDPHEKFDYILVLDADEVLIKGEKLLQDLAKLDSPLNKDAYGVYVTNESNYILSPRLLKPHIRYEGAIHNQPVGFKTMGTFKYEDILIDHVHDGARAYDPEKLDKDVEMLQKIWDTTRDRNYGFYLGATLRAKGESHSAALIFSEVADMKIKDEISHSAFMRIGQINYLEGETLPTMFVAYLNFLDAHAVRPTCEALYYLMKISREMGKYDLALRLGNRVDFSVMASYVDPVIREHEYEMEVLRSFMHVKKDRAKKAAEELMDRDLPKETREELSQMIAEL